MNALFFKFSRLGKKMFLNIPVSTSTAENPGSVRSVPFPVVVADFLSFVHEKYCESFVSQQDIKDYKYSGGFCYFVSKFLPKDSYFFLETTSNVYYIIVRKYHDIYIHTL